MSVSLGRPRTTNLPLSSKSFSLREQLSRALSMVAESMRMYVYLLCSRGNSGTLPGGGPRRGSTPQIATPSSIYNVRALKTHARLAWQTWQSWLCGWHRRSVDARRAVYKPPSPAPVVLSPPHIDCPTTRTHKCPPQLVTPRPRTLRPRRAPTHTRLRPTARHTTAAPPYRVMTSASPHPRPARTTTLRLHLCRRRRPWTQTTTTGTMW